MTIEEKLNALPEDNEGDLFVKKAWTQTFYDYEKAARHSYITDSLFEALAEQVSDAYEAGREAAYDDAKRIVYEVMQKFILSDLKTKPDITLKSFAQRNGFRTE